MEDKRIFGREHFLESLTTDGLELIGHEHFKITKKEGNFYLKDLKSKNGTKINEIKLKKGEEVELSGDDKITVADVLDLKFMVL
jgi:pSer/pThr/pTyr-binding forkhead associated (FHA) protein